MKRATPEKPPIEAVLYHYGAQYVPHRPGWASMLCPFHDDKHQSASVNTNEGAFRCHTCGVKGDSYSLIQEREGIGFRDAIEFGARVFGEGHTYVRDVQPASKYLPRGQGTRSKSRKYVPPGRR